MSSLCKRLGFTHCETRTLALPLLPSFRLLCEGRIELSCPGGRVGPKRRKPRDALKGAGARVHHHTGVWRNWPAPLQPHSVRLVRTGPEGGDVIAM